MNPFSWHIHRFLEWLHTLAAGHHHERFNHHHERAIEHGLKADVVEARRPPPGAGSEPLCEPPHDLPRYGEGEIERGRP